MYNYLLVVFLPESFTGYVVKSSPYMYEIEIWGVHL
jgi:hypothetical protein